MYREDGSPLEIHLRPEDHSVMLPGVTSIRYEGDPIINGSYHNEQANRMMGTLRSALTRRAAKATRMNSDSSRRYVYVHSLIDTIFLGTYAALVRINVCACVLSCIR